MTAEVNVRSLQWILAVKGSDFLKKKKKIKAHYPPQQNENQAKDAQMCKVSFGSNYHIVFT